MFPVHRSDLRACQRAAVTYLDPRVAAGTAAYELPNIVQEKRRRLPYPGVFEGLASHRAEDRQLHVVVSLECLAIGGHDVGPVRPRSPPAKRRHHGEETVWPRREELH